MITKSFPKESEEMIFWGIKAYDEYLSDSLDAKTLEKEIFEVIGPMIRQRGYFTKTEGEKILSWRTPLVPRFYQKNTEEMIQRFSLQAFSATDEIVAIQILTLLHGISFKSASKLFAVFNPDKYAVFLEEVWAIFVEWKYLSKNFQSNPHFWERYIQAIERMRKKYEISARKVEKSLIALYLKFELKQNSINHIPLDQFFS